MILDYTGQPWKIAHAADRSQTRGPQFAVRNDDIEKLIPSNDRKTLVSLSNRLFFNMGVPRACITQKADYSVDEAWIPSYLGKSDQEEGKIAARFINDIWLPQCDVIGGIFDWWKLLELTSIEIDRSGDSFWYLTVGNDGFPRIQMLPSHRCYSDSGMMRVTEGLYAGYRIIDGIIYYSSGRAAAYRFNIGMDGKENFVDIPASEIIHIFEPTHSEQRRGLPCFTHALESLKMSLLSLEDERVRQQIVSRLHLTVFNSTGLPDDLQSDLLGTGDTGIGSFSTRSFPGGVQYLPAEGGHRIEQMRHENPGVVWESFQDRMIRDSVIPVWSYSVWKGSTQGTDVRAEVGKCRRFVKKRQSTLWIPAMRAVSWAYSIFAKQGRVPVLKSPTKWDFSRPPRLTVDDGRESKMEIEEVRVGTKNLNEVLEGRGINEDEFISSRARAIWHRKYKARMVAEELNKAHGVDIKVEDREMFMLTANEVREVEWDEEPVKQNEEEEPE